MVKYNIFVIAGMAVALPLNINLGAYSPALVVGDGEISFGGGQDVSNLINALEGAAVNAASGAATNGAAAAPAAAVPAAESPAAGGEAQAPATANAAAPDAALQEQAQQIAALQGMGKEIAPRVEIVDAPSVGKRDLAGFDRALQYAEAALVKGPKVSLGTGEGGSGVGIIVDNNQEAAARAGSGTAEKRKRDLDLSSPKLKVTTMYVRSGIPAALQSSENNVASRAVAAPAVAAAPSVSRRDVIDAVNLNVDGNQGLTMTFVETVDDDEE